MKSLLWLCVIRCQRKGADTVSLKATRVQGETTIQAQDENGYENCFSTTEFIYQANLVEGPFQAWGWQEARKVKFLSHEAKLWSRCRYGIPEIKHTFFSQARCTGCPNAGLGWE